MSPPSNPLPYAEVCPTYRMGGEEGFEPSNAGSKVRCLTTWRLPTGRVDGSSGRSVTHWSPARRGSPVMPLFVRDAGSSADARAVRVSPAFDTHVEGAPGVAGAHHGAHRPGGDDSLLGVRGIDGGGPGDVGGGGAGRDCLDGAARPVPLVGIPRAGRRPDRPARTALSPGVGGAVRAHAVHRRERRGDRTTLGLL